MSTIQTPDRHQSYHTSIWKSEVDQQLEIEISFYLRHENQSDFKHLINYHPEDRTYLSHKEHAAEFCADNIGAVLLRNFIESTDLKIKKENLDNHQVIVTGTIQTFSDAFKVAFSIHESPNGREHLNYTGKLYLPEELEHFILNISGLHNGLIKGKRSPIATTVGASTNEHKGYSPQQIQDYYDFPPVKAYGQCIGLIELGGDFKMSDIEEYCKIFKVPVPEIVTVGTKPKVPTQSQTVDNLEVTLDIQMIAGLAQSARIVVYYASSIPEAMHLAIHDTKNNPSILSISWAISEMNCSIADREFIDQMSYQAILKGITVIAASGDHGAYNGQKYLNVNLPASNPCVLGCGGTELKIAEKSEVVWGDGTGLGTGGGYSKIYPIPAFQELAIKQYTTHYFPYGGNNRGIPDISANSSPNTGYSIVMDGQLLGIGAGTSASTPVWAALFARLNFILGYRVGWVNDIFYKLASTSSFNQILQGNNGYYPAAPGWSPTTGLGTPNGVGLYNGIKELKKIYPVHKKTETGSAQVVTESAPKKTATKKAVAKKPAAKKTTTKKAVVKKAAAKKPTAKKVTATKPAVKKPVAKKPVAKKPVVKKTTTAKTTTKRTTAKATTTKTATTKATPKKTTTRKVAPRKAAPKKAAPRKTTPKKKNAGDGPF